MIPCAGRVLKRSGVSGLKTGLTIGSAKRNISPASRLGYEQSVREFLEFMGTRQNGPLESISERDIDGFIDHLTAGGRGAGTINKLVRKYLSGAFEKARKLGKIKYNPVMATDPLEHKASQRAVHARTGRPIGRCRGSRLGGHGSLRLRFRGTAPGRCQLALERPGSRERACHLYRTQDGPGSRYWASPGL